MPMDFNFFPLIFPFFPKISVKRQSKIPNFHLRFDVDAGNFEYAIACQRFDTGLVDFINR